MKAKKIFPLLLLYLIIFFESQAYAQNWFPLEVGNKWQYLVEGSFAFSYENYDKYSLEEYSIDADTFFNDHTYYMWSKYPGYWIRYDESDQSIYVWWNDSDNVFMNFSIPIDSTINRFEPFTNDYHNSYIENRSFDYNDNSYDVKGYLGYEATDLPVIWAYNYFYPGWGWVYDEEWGWDMGAGGSWVKTKKLIQSNIGGNNYSENYFPQINIDPLTAINNSTFQLIPEVHHQYNHVFPDSSINHGLNFIDTVKMHSFYSRGNTVLRNTVIYGTSISGAKKWEINTTLDMDLIRDDYKFNYRIEAIDKGLIPHRSFSPDTGYYIAVFDTTTDVIDIHEPLTLFKLYQNYPNPFNPTTSILYATNSRQLVTLKVFDILGNEIVTLVNNEKPAGEYKVEFDGSNLPSGIYFYQLKAGNYIKIRKMILLK